MNSCSKTWLDEKPSKTLAVPQTYKDYQAILNDEYTLNRGYGLSGTISMDWVYVSDNDINQLEETDLNIYRWDKNINYGPSAISREWDGYFSIVRTANVVIDGMSNLNKQSDEAKSIIGQAHFFRALGYYYLAQFFCKPYVEGTANEALGLPIRTSSDVNQIEQRSKLSSVYALILSDLNIAANNMSFDQVSLTRPNKTAAWALYAKVNLIMSRYEQAKLYADSVISKKPDLIDFNDTKYVSHALPYKFLSRGNGNPEVIFYSYSYSGVFESSYLGNIVQVSPEFYSTYSDNDRRKEFFYGQSAGKNNFVGTYSGDSKMFQGIATNEIYLIRAECNARLNNLVAAKSDLNLLLNKRFKTGTAPNIEDINSEVLLKQIIEERNKEFPRVSNIWWEDLRRLNLESRFQRTLNRTVNGKQLILSPNDSRYVFPISEKEIRLTGIEQNQR